MTLRGLRAFVVDSFDRAGDRDGDRDTDRDRDGDKACALGVNQERAER